MEKYKILLVVALAVMYSLSGAAQEPSDGFTDHGVASPVSSHRGTVATVDAEGKNVVLVWLFDHRGGYALLMVDAETGASREFPVPFDPEKDVPYSSLLSTRNKYYTLFNGNFLEFDPVERAFTFHQTTMPKMAMGMTEDDNGVIWAVTYPNSGVISFDPATRIMNDYGYVYSQNWRQYQRFVATDDRGWLYFAVGNTASQIVAFNPATGSAQGLLTEPERRRGMAYLYRDLNGKVYGQALQDSEEPWYEFYNGERKTIGRISDRNPKSIITGSQGLFHAKFPDGRIVHSCSLLDRTLAVRNPVTNEVKEVSFDYSSEGAWVMGVAATPDGRLCGGTTFPMRYFSYAPKSNTWENERASGQFNAMACRGNSFFFGVYPGGYILEWDPAQPWSGGDKRTTGGNPQFLAEASPDVYRPHRLLAHSDEKTLIMGGTPQYGYTGGGLMLWNRVNRAATILKDVDVVPDQSTMSMVSLPDGSVLCGTTTAPGSGGEKKAREAEIYRLDVAQRKMKWSKAFLPGVQEYSDMCVGKGGLVFGVADKKIFFVFDPRKRKVLHTEDASTRFGITTGEQSPRIFVKTDRENIYLLFKKGIVELDEESFALKMVAEAPVPIDAGGDYVDGKIYFVNGSHIWSYECDPR